MSVAEAAWPVEIAVRDAGRTLAVTFDDGAAFDLPAEYLRVMSPSAEVQGHSRRERKTVGGKRNVAVIGADPIGSYAVRLSFDDMHSTGIFTWSYLYELGQQRETNWADYIADLDAKALSRDRAGDAVRGDA